MKWMWDLLNNQLFALATIIGTIITLPAFIEYLVERRKRKERLALSLDVEDVEDLKPRVAGLDGLLAESADLIDRARDPGPYAQIPIGNEMLILGPPQIGKRSLALRIAKDAALDRVITVYNPRNKDALRRAKSLLSAGSDRVMLLLPRIDLVFERHDEDLLAELDALIETTTDKEHVLVVGTAVGFEPDGDLDNLFGTKLVLPGTPRSEEGPRHVPEDARRMLGEVARFYLNEATQQGFALSGIGPEEVVSRLLSRVTNAAEVEDIAALCRTRAIYEKRQRKSGGLEITPEVLERAIARVIVNIRTVPPRRD